MKTIRSSSVSTTHLIVVEPASMPRNTGPDAEVRSACRTNARAWRPSNAARSWSSANSARIGLLAMDAVPAAASSASMSWVVKTSRPDASSAAPSAT